ncbi:uncharacterized protein LOC129777538 isoform X2 [Toxorhynchites rutilus septentrionalis]|nr:uncharacterized protein LOC129777538 isoform X2 [Toxorhynchites rutilus septentrionalis]
MLKDWLVRRRENPYPNREEKKQLACETGLTYTQICNWFANWRRKLKNSGHDPAKKTWGILIKNYNTNAKGNVEQFSICSGDSIWGENDNDSQRSGSTPPGYLKQRFATYGNNNTNGSVSYMKFVEHSSSETSEDETPGNYSENDFFDHCYTPRTTAHPMLGIPGQAQCFQITSTTEEGLPDFNMNTSSVIAASFPNAFQGENGTFYLTPSTTVSPAFIQKSTNKYKNSIMEKYLRDLSEVKPEPNNEHLSCSSPFQQLATHTQVAAPCSQVGCEIRGPPSLSKWLESTAKFTPSKNNYIDWDQSCKPSSSKKRFDPTNNQSPHPNQHPTPNSLELGMHQKDEIDAAEALTRLANNFRLKFYT